MASAATQLVIVGGYASPDQPGIHAFAFDATGGQLAPLGGQAGLSNPSFLALHPNGRFLYAVSEAEPAGAVHAFAMGRDPWRLSPLNQETSGGAHPCHLAIDRAGNWLLVANYSGGSVGLIHIMPDGSLGELHDLAQHQGHGPHEQRQEGPHAHSSIFSPDGRLAIVADLGIDQLVTYRVDDEDGRLIDAGGATTRPGAGPRHMVFSLDGRLLYVANELDCTVGTFAYDAAAGTLGELNSLSTLPEGAGPTTVADIHISADGKHLYVSNRGHNSIAVYRLGADGLPQPAATVPCGGDWPRNFALAPGGRFMLVANQHSGELTVLPLEDGIPGEPVARAAVPGASCVLVV